MQTAPEIIFHDVDRSEWVERCIAERVERFAEGILPPNHDLAAKKERVVRDMQTELPALINQAFGAIENQVKKTSQLRRT